MNPTFGAMPLADVYGSGTAARDIDLSSIQELLILGGVVAAVLFGPRLRGMLTANGAGPARPDPARTETPGLSGLLRLAIVASLVVPLVAALIFEPWHGNVRSFITLGLAPVALGWCAWWVSRGFKDSGGAD